MKVYVRRICYPIISLGPGNRVAIWFSGCNKKCAGCISPELQVRSKNDGLDIELLKEALYAISEQGNIDGITISGGEALDQFDAVLEIGKFARDTLRIMDILLFTGYDQREISTKFSFEEQSRLYNSISVIVTGPYVEHFNQPQEDKYANLRGSMNQSIIFNDKQFIPIYEKYCENGRKLQLIQKGNSMLFVGIP